MMRSTQLNQQNTIQSRPEKDLHTQFEDFVMFAKNNNNNPHARLTEQHFLLIKSFLTTETFIHNPNFFPRLLASIIKLKGTWQDFKPYGIDVLIRNTIIDNVYYYQAMNRCFFSSPFDLTSIFWSITELNLEYKDFVQDSFYKYLFIELKYNLEKLNAIDIVRVLSTLPQFKIDKDNPVTWKTIQTERLSEQLLDAIGRNFLSFDSQMITSILIFFNQVNFTWKNANDEGIASRLIYAIKNNINSFKTIDISKIFLTLALFGLQWQELKSVDNVLQRLTDLNITLNDFGNNPLYLMLVGVLKENINQFDSKKFSTMFRGLAKLNMPWKEIEELKLDQLLLDNFYQNLPNFSPNQFSYTVWSFVIFDLTFDFLENQKIKSGFIDTLIHIVPRYNHTQIATLLWSLAHMDVSWDFLKLHKLDHLMLDAIYKNQNNFTPEEAGEILQAKIFFGFDLPEKLHTLLIEQSMKRTTESSHTHLIISHIIKKLTNEKLENEFCYGYTLWVDIAFPKKNIIIEIDGPVHLCLERIRRDNFKEKLLTKLGIKVIRISNWDKNEKNIDLIKNILTENGISLKESEKKQVQTIIKNNKQVRNISQKHSCNQNQFFILQEKNKIVNLSSQNAAKKSNKK